jgi:hypothetical protein
MRLKGMAADMRGQHQLRGLSLPKQRLPEAALLVLQRRVLAELLGIAQVSRNQIEYEGHVKRIFGQQFEMDL